MANAFLSLYLYLYLSISLSLSLSLSIYLHISAYIRRTGERISLSFRKPLNILQKYQGALLTG